MGTAFVIDAEATTSGVLPVKSTVRVQGRIARSARDGRLHVSLAVGRTIARKQSSLRKQKPPFLAASLAPRLARRRRGSRCVAALVLAVTWAFEISLSRAALLAPVIVVCAGAATGLAVLWAKVSWEALRGRGGRGSWPGSQSPRSR